MGEKTLSSAQFLNDIHGKNLNFLIGAGASDGLVPTLDLSQLGEEETFEKLYSGEGLNSKQQKVLDFIWFESWIQHTLKDKNDIEKMKKDGSASYKVYGNYKKFITKLGRFSNNEGYDKPKRVNIFTTNYDSLFELAFDEVSQKQRMIYFNDGSRGFLNRYISIENFNLNISHSAMSDNFQKSIPTINLLKIHGSVTWDLEGNRIKASINSKVFEKVKTNAEKLSNTIKNYRVINALFFNKKDLTVDEKNNVKKILKKELLKFYHYNKALLRDFKNSYKNLQVVNPTKDKFRETVFRDHYYQLLRMLSYELEKRDSVLIVFGFSFEDEHILEIVRRSITNPSLKTFVIAYDEKAKKNLKSKFKDMESKSIEFLPRDYKDSYNTPLGPRWGNFKYLNDLFSGSDDLFI